MKGDITSLRTQSLLIVLQYLRTLRTILLSKVNKGNTLLAFISNQLQLKINNTVVRKTYFTGNFSEKKYISHLYIT